MHQNLPLTCFFTLIMIFCRAQDKLHLSQTLVTPQLTFSKNDILIHNPGNISYFSRNGKINREYFDEAPAPEPLEIFYLNAYNFSLGGPLLSNYLGRLNIFNHSVNKSRWAYNLGFTTINYSIGNSDSVNFLALQNVITDPLADSIKAGQKYLSQFNRLTTKVQNRSLSFFGQLLYRINKPGGSDRFQLFGHFHLELLVNKISTTTTVTNLEQDSITQPTTIKVPDSFFRYMPPNYTRTNSFLNGYYGLGITMYSRPIDSLSIFLQLTAGVTTNAPNLSSVNDQPNRTYLPPPIVRIVPNPVPQSQPSSPSNVRVDDGSGASNGLRFFYYIHGYINYNVTKAIQGVVGGEIRGIGKYNPYYAVYAGINLNIESIFSALK